MTESWRFTDDPEIGGSVWSQEEPASWREEEDVRGLGDHLLEFARENPAAAALWCFGIGFIVGWRLKPW